MRLRPPTLQDADRVLELLVARDMRDFGRPDVTLGDVLDEWNASDLELGVDAVVVEADDGRLVGYAIARRPGTFAVVSPDHERRGIGSLLLDWTRANDRARGRRRHRQWVASGNAHASELLTSAGYLAVRSYWRMTRRLTGEDPDGAFRSLDVDRDAIAVYECSEASFAAVADYEPESLQEFTEEHLGAHDLAPQLSLIAEQDGRVTGFLLARRWPDDDAGYIDVLAVHPDRQRRGLGGALLRAAFARFAAAGLREAELGVASDNPRALSLYESHGMTPRFRVDTYERPLDPDVKPDVEHE